jgi:hypothetical protein
LTLSLLAGKYFSAPSKNIWLLNLTGLDRSLLQVFLGIFLQQLSLVWVQSAAYGIADSGARLNGEARRDGQEGNAEQQQFRADHCWAKMRIDTVGGAEKNEIL